jgi:hypothetical protein
MGGDSRIAEPNKPGAGARESTDFSVSSLEKTGKNDFALRGRANLLARTFQTGACAVIV